MRVYAIRNNVTPYSAPKLNKRVQKQNATKSIQQPVQNEVAFKNKTASLGVAFTLLGAGAAMVMSGGLATPAAVAMIAGATGTSGALIGSCMDEVKASNRSA